MVSPDPEVLAVEIDPGLEAQPAAMAAAVIELLHMPSSRLHVGNEPVEAFATAASICVPVGVV